MKSADPEAMNQLLQPVFERKAYEAARKEGRILTKGLPAGPGAACGEIAFSASKAEELARKGKNVVLVRIETSPEDLRGMIAADGILTTRGGVSSHAALVARQMGKVCVAGAGEISIDYHAGTMTCGGRTLREGDHLSINCTTGEVIEGLGRIEAEGLAAAVTAGGHQGAAKALRQQLVQRRSRQHHPQSGATGGHPGEGLALAWP
jgi:pyruvate,orthophosphate dikinase